MSFDKLPAGEDPSINLIYCAIAYSRYRAKRYPALTRNLRQLRQIGNGQQDRSLQLCIGADHARIDVPTHPPE